VARLNPEALGNARCKESIDGYSVVCS
jgi:hypothetical protein